MSYSPPSNDSVDLSPATGFAPRLDNHLRAATTDEGAVGSDVLLAPFGPVFRNPATVRFDPRVELIKSEVSIIDK